MKKPGIRIATMALAAGMVTLAQLPALAAATSTSPSVTIAATSNLPKETGDVWVIYQDPVKYSAANIAGAISNGTTGNVVKLYAQQFPFKKAAVPTGAPITLTATGTTPYSFKASPSLATRYQVKLFATSTSATPLATSAVTTVYVWAQHRYGGLKPCRRPTCHQTVHVRIILPASTLRTERKKHVYVYFGIRLSTQGAPPPPSRITLGGGGARVVSVQKVNTHQYEITITFAFHIGNDGYYFEFDACQKDSEAVDGLNLPGKHGCGRKSISTSINYLGVERA